MTDSQEEKNARLKIIRKAIGFTQQQMADILGIERSNLSKIEQGIKGRNAPKDTYYILRDRIGLRKEYWEYGEEPIIDENFSKSNQEESNDTNYSNFNNYKNKTGVPFYDIDVTATIAESYLDSKENPEYYVDFPPFNDCDAFTRVYGDSMYPKYQSGEIIAIKKLNNFDIMRWGETHLIITDSHYDNLRTIKNIHPCENDDSAIIIEASNPKFKGENKILKKHILGLFLVKGKASVHHM